MVFESNNKMIDIFSTEFLTSLKQQVKYRTKTSKALLDAIKDLTISNQNIKKKMSQMQTQIKTLKEENMMLMEMLQTSKQDYEKRIELKDKKLQNAINIEAKLYAENEGLKKQIEMLKGKLEIFKNLPITSMRSLPKDKDELETSPRDLTEKVSKASEPDLNAYLFSQKQRTQKQHEIYEDDGQNDISIDTKMNGKYKQDVDRKIMHKSQYFPSNTKLKRSQIFSKILHDD